MTQNFGVYFRLQKVAMVGETENTHKLIILSMIYPFFPKMVKMGRNDKISTEWVKNRYFSFYKNCKKCTFFQLVEKMVAPVYRGQTLFFGFFSKFSRPGFCVKYRVKCILCKNGQKMVQNGNRWFRTKHTFFPNLDNFGQFCTTFRKKTPEHPDKNRSFRTKRVKFPRKNRLLVKFSKIHQKSPNLPSGSSTYIDDDK